MFGTELSELNECIRHGLGHRHFTRIHSGAQGGPDYRIGFDKCLFPHRPGVFTAYASHPQYRSCSVNFNRGLSRATAAHNQRFNDTMLP